MSKEPALEPVRRPALSDEVIHRIRARIASGDWPVGTRIPPEPELMRQLQVARGTVREAVRALAHTGLLEVRRGDGTYVRAKSELSGAVARLYGDSDLGQLLEVREGLDAQAARLAAVRADESALDTLHHTLERRAAAWHAGDFEAWVEADWAFHCGVADASGNPLLAELYRNLAGPLRTAMAGAWATPGFQGADPVGHETLLTALRAGDAAEAGRQAAANVSDTRAWDDDGARRA
ncbi:MULTISPECIES: FadR/GntR family transcriptional regulator [Streptomyces]|uniref:FadR/GntR family transcriptional regulator n=1 Tax=Streptomyces luteosporeus TaxID=173856 RepID=A0ABN3TJ69_9ACTN